MDEYSVSSPPAMTMGASSHLVVERSNLFDGFPAWSSHVKDSLINTQKGVSQQSGTSELSTKIHSDMVFLVVSCHFQN